MQFARPALLVREAACLCLLALFFVSSAAAQSSPMPEKPVIRSDVNEVLMDLVVRDKHGRPTTDLQPSEIEITDDGSPVKITGVHLVSGAAAANRAGAAQIHQVRLMSLVFDQLHTESTRSARKLVQDLLKRGAEQDIAFSVWKLSEHLELVQTFTNRQGSVERAVDSILEPKKGRKTGGSGQDLSLIERNMEPFAAKMLDTGEISQHITQEENVSPFVAGLLALVRQQTSFAGRKALLYLSDGLAVATCSPAQLESIVGAANRANVSIYSIDTRGVAQRNEHTEGLMILHGSTARLGPQGPQTATNGLAQPAASDALNGITSLAAATSLATAASLRESQNIGNRVSIRELAQRTGGFYITEDSASGSAGRIVEDSSTYYEATYSPQHLEYDGHFRTISVKVARPHVKVQSRAGYFSFPPNVAADIRVFELPLLKALGQPQRTQTVPLHARVLHFGQQGDEARAELVLEAPMSSLGYREDNKLYKMHLSVLALVRGDKGQIAQKMSEDLPLQTAKENADAVRAGTFTFQRSFSVPPGKYSVDLAFSDQLNKTLSTATIPFSLTPEPNGLRLSDISLVRRVESKRGSEDPLMEYQGHRVISELELEPQAATREVPFFFTIYPQSGSSSKPEVEFELRQHNNLFAKSSLALPASLPGDPIPIVASFPLKALPAGDYDMVAKATQDGLTCEQALAFSVSGNGPPERRGQALSAHAEQDTVHLAFLVKPKLLEGRQKPNDAEIKRVIDTAKQRAIDYKNDLPNFTCTVVTRRAVDKNGRGDWRQWDLITELLRYVDGNEEHKTLQVNSRNQAADPDTGVHSGGEFGMFLDTVFSDKAGAHFEWQGYAEVNGQQTDAYRYEVALPHSLYGLSSKSWRISVAYHGFVYIDPNTMDVRRVSIEADNVPKEFPIRESALTVDYSYFSIGAQQYLLPKIATLYVRQGKRRLARNEKEFREYRRYTGESTIRFD